MREALVLLIDWHMFWSRREVSVVGVSRAFYFRVEKIDPIRHNTFLQVDNMHGSNDYALWRLVRVVQTSIQNCKYVVTAPELLLSTQELPSIECSFCSTSSFDHCKTHLLRCSGRSVPNQVAKESSV